MCGAFAIQRFVDGDAEFDGEFPSLVPVEQVREKVGVVHGGCLPLCEYPQQVSVRTGAELEQVLGVADRSCENGPVIKLIRRGAIAGALAGLALAAWKFLAARSPDTAGVRYEPQPFPMPPRPIPPAPIPPAPARPTPTPAASDPPASDLPASDPPAVEPDAEGNCPVSHPIKGKRTSGIYHQPGGFAYDRTRADRCYLDAAAAEHDGLRAAKR